MPSPKPPGLTRPKSKSMMPMPRKSGNTYADKSARAFMKRIRKSMRGR